MARFIEYGKYDAIGLADLVRSKQIDPVEVLEEAITRLEDLNPKLNAVVHRHFELAMDSIRLASPDTKAAPFFGVPFLLKDNIYLKGTLTTHGSRLYQDYCAPFTSTLVHRYINAGLAIMGKTNTPEFGLTITTEPELYGATRNPWNLECSSGGSSGGAAAAVAAGIVPMANASDGGGSIRVPASACGLFGLKPTRARTPVGPEKGEAWSGCNSVHALTRTVRDSAALLDACHGPSSGDPYAAPAFDGSFLSICERDPKPLRIGFSTLSPLKTKIDPECVKAVEVAAKMCADLGHEVEETASPLDGRALAKTLGNVVAANISWMVDNRKSNMHRFILEEAIERITWRTVSNGRNLSAKDHLDTLTEMHAAGRLSARFHETFDVFIEPTLGKPPVPLGTIDMMSENSSEYSKELLEASPFTGRYNLTGQPSMSMPLHWSATGLPIGVMLTAGFGEDALLLSLAAQIERAYPWANKQPKVVK